MFVLAIALHAAAVAAPPPADPRAQVSQGRIVRKARVARRPVRTARNSVQFRQLVPLCPNGSCAADRGAQYRLPLGNTDGAFDPKMRAVRDEGMACGVTGAPVCPSKGATVLTSQID